MKIVDRPSPNFDARGGAPVDILVLHYTGMTTAEEALARLCDPAAKVSAHYTIDRDGAIYRHVDEQRRAWHAGVSYWAGARDVNARSIGIELVNPGHEFGYVPFAEPQIEALIELARAILSRHPIAKNRVLGHSDVSPSRKTDPGELFPWKFLAEKGVGLWPSLPPRWGAKERQKEIPSPLSGGEGESGDAFLQNLRRYGYGAPPEVDWPIEDTIRAFQRHFRPSCIDGMADAECAALLEELLQT